MSKFGLVILFFLLAGECNAQNYFVFIDAGNRQPFYVRLDSQFYSSSAEGHIILSRLRDSLYDITIGFPGQTAQEQHYAFGIRGKDQAFEIRDHGGDAPGLFDLQTNEWMRRVYARGNGPDEFRSTGTKKDDAFSRMMAGVVHDTAVLYNTYAMEQALPATTLSPTASDTPAARRDTTAAGAATAAIASSVPSARGGTGLIKADTNLAKPDTSLTKPDAGVVFSKQNVKTTPDRIDMPFKSDSGVVAIPKLTSATPDTPGQLYRPLPTMASPDTINNTTSLATAPTITPAAATTAPPNAMSAPPAATTAPPINSTAAPDTATQLYRPIGHQPVADTAGLLFRPMAGTSAHKAAPGVDSLDKTPLFRPVAHVTKLSERRSLHSVRLVYSDQSQGKKTDTIVVIIPVDTIRTSLTRSHGPNGNADSPTLSQNTVFRPLAPAGSLPADNVRPANQVDTQRHPGKGASVYVNSDCHNFANDLDVDKLRAKMLEAARDDERIAVARKAFKVKCFYTHYIRSLSEVFTTDAAKYRFFEAAWPFAADEHFHELSNLLADPVYTGKFRTLTSHP